MERRRRLGCVFEGRWWMSRVWEGEGWNGYFLQGMVGMAARDSSSCCWDIEEKSTKEQMSVVT